MRDRMRGTQMRLPGLDLPEKPNNYLLSKMGEVDFDFEDDPEAQISAREAFEQDSDPLRGYTSAHDMNGGLFGDHAKFNPLYGSNSSDYEWEHIPDDRSHAEVAQRQGISDYFREDDNLQRGAPRPAITKPRVEFVPTEKISSEQRLVNQSAIDHQLEHADPMNLKYLPQITQAGDNEAYRVLDGNHRVNAALGRGQLFVEANVQSLYPTQGPVEVPSEKRRIRAEKAFGYDGGLL